MRCSRPHPFRSALEPGAPRAAQRPHRPQAAARQDGVVPLLRLRAARGGRRPPGAGAKDRDHPRPARLGRPGDQDRIRSAGREGIPRRKRRRSPRRSTRRDDDERLAPAVEEMDDDEQARHERQAKDIDDLRARSERLARAGRRRSGGAQRVVATRSHAPAIRSTPHAAGEVGETRDLPPRSRPIPLSRHAGWPEALDDLRIRRRKRAER